MTGPKPLDPQLIDSRFLTRFHSKYQKGSECWLWTSTCNSDGYPIISTIIRRPHSIMYRASRVMYYIIHNIDPYPLLVLHKCDNIKCINPSHLVLGTPKDNTADMFAKGRATRPIEINNVLTKEQVVEVYKLILSGTLTQHEIASRYSVTQSTISNIATKTTWSHVTNGIK